MDIYLTSEVAACLDVLQASDVKTINPVDDATYALSRARQAQNSKAPAPRLADRAASWLELVALWPV